MCDLEAIGVPSIFKFIHKGTALTRMFPTFDLRCEENTTHGNGRLISQVEHLKLQKSGKFPDESTKIKGAHTHSGDGPR